MPISYIQPGVLPLRARVSTTCGAGTATGTARPQQKTNPEPDNPALAVRCQPTPTAPIARPTTLGFGASFLATLAAWMTEVRRRLAPGPSSPVVVAPTQPAGADGASLTDLMQQAMAIIKLQYPNSTLYEVSGTRNDNPMVDANDFTGWKFGAIDDADHPTGTVYIAYRNGEFTPTVATKKFDYDRELSEISPKIDLNQAIADLRNAGYSQDFRYADLFRVFNPAFRQLVYVFSSETAIITVGAEDGVVTQHRPQDWPAGQIDPEGVLGRTL